MARVDAIVLGAGIVGTSAALQLARRGLAVAQVDRRGPGEETSYGNAGVIGGAGVYPTPFPRRLGTLLRVALKLSPEANYHLSALPRLAPWLWAYFRESHPARLEAAARALRPLMARSVAEHEALAREARAEQFLRKNGWISVYRTDAAFKALAPQLELGAELGVRFRTLDVAGARALEPGLAPVFRHAVHWPDIASVSNPFALTRAYAARFAELGGVLLRGDARSLHRNGRNWRVDTAEGPVDSPEVVVALGPWSVDVLAPLGLRLPLAVKRGYHRHYRPRGTARLERPVVDAEIGYVLAPMEQGIRLTTGAEFAARDAPPTPVQFRRLMPYATALFPLGEPVEAQPWMGARPCFPDMRPVIGRTPGQPGLWLDCGHNHFGLTLGPVSGRLLAEMMTGEAPFCDPAPFAAERFAA
ncbi:MAG: FAD-binding oxidoreductase [Variibacter sp.]|nr:FAD-binding oxidoreductase [Variibacter sp.]